MSWEIRSIGDVCTLEKGNIGITKAIDGEYPLVVLGEERKTHNEFQFDDEAVVIPLVSSTGHGHRSMKRIHYQSGKFSVGNILCAVIPKDKSKLSAQYLYRYLDLNKEKELVSRMKGMANVSLPMKSIAEVEIPIPPIEVQYDIVSIFEALEETNYTLQDEQSHQLSLLKKLRQQILQDAVQGKLVPQDPIDEPASVLLERIKAEKEKLVRENKIKKEKPLPPIRLEEIPFEIPENWSWCRLSEIFDVRDGTHDTPKYVNNGVPFITSKNISSGRIDFKDVKYISLSDHIEFSKRSKVEQNDILFAMIGSIGNPVIVQEIEQEFSIKNVALFKNFFKTNLRTDYLYWYLRNESENFNKISRGAIQRFVSLQILRQNLIPLPPLQEQHRIVAKIEQLMTLCDELEQSIEQNQKNTQELLQVALKEVLEPKTNLSIL